MTQTIFPAVRYADADAALAFLKAAFGAGEKAVYRDEAGVIHHGEVLVEGNVVMIGTLPADELAGTGSQKSAMSLYVVVSDPDAHHAVAVAAGATVTRELEDMDYGSREYSVRDPGGYMWSFGTYDPFAGA